MTMRSITKKRLALVEQAIGQVPVPADVRQAAFEVFKATGELPQDDRVTMSVFDRVQRGEDMPIGPITQIDWATAIQSMMRNKPRPKDVVMDSLFVEALHEAEIVRIAARTLLRILAVNGIDVTGTPFHGKEVPLPTFGSLGMHYMCVLEGLARPPYVRQAKRLFRRVDDLRERVLKRSKWHAALDDAVDRFHLTSELPSEEVLLDGVLVLGEINALMRHAGGEDVTELMARLDEIARAKGKERRDEAIGKLQAMAEAGLLVPTQDSALA